VKFSVISVETAAIIFWFKCFTNAYGSKRYLKCRQFFKYSDEFERMFRSFGQNENQNDFGMG
jgi:hypothetical protein